jgi:tRNA A37 threonylcarbamoyladenosine dehydratase
MEKYNRNILLFGEENFQKLSEKRVILFGVGGVGSFALDCLYRTGITKITIVDFDTYDESNRNRQLWSDNAIGQKKVTTLKKIYPEIKIIDKKISPEWVEDFDFSNFDLVLDAIDDISSKVAIAKKVSKKLISSTGSANQIDATKIRVISIWKTEHDPLAKKFRNELRKSGFREDFKVIWSGAERVGERSGTFVGVTASFGLNLCSAGVQFLQKD